MSEAKVTREGLRGVHPGREATPAPGGKHRRRGRAGRRDSMGRRAEQPMVPPAEFTSYYGKPILNPPVWRSPDIPGYLFLGGLAGGSSLLAAGAQLTGRPALARVTKAGAAGAASLSLAGLVHDLGRPARFLNMLGGRSRAISALAGASLLAASAATRWGVFHAGLASAADPKYTVVPQRERLRARQQDQREAREQAAS